MSSSYRADIDGMRACAVAAVIVHHFDKDLLPSGYLGVDVFFVISGYVISASLAGRPASDFWNFLIGFYERRMKRLLPALIAYVLVVGVTICLFDPNPKSSLKTGIGSLFGVSNIYLFKESTDYFAQSTELNPFTHTWSLGVEEQFYLVFPLLFWASGLGRRTSGGVRNLGIMMGVLSVASLAGFVYLHRTNTAAAYFLMPPRFWELATGCLVFLAENSGRIPRVLTNLPPLAVVTAMVGVLFAPRGATVPATLSMVMLSALLLGSLRKGSVIFRVFTNRWIVFAGVISYSLYLWHWGVLSLSRWTIGVRWWTAPIQVMLVVASAVLCHAVIESPLRRRQWPVGGWRLLGCGLGVSACSALLLHSLYKFPDASLYSGRRASLVAAGVSSLTAPYRVAGVDSKWSGGPCVVANNSEVGKTIVLENCTLGGFDEAKRRVLVLGNSFSTAFVQAFDELVVADGYAVTITSAWGGSPVPGMPCGDVGTHDKSNEYYWTSVVPRLIDRLRGGDWVFLVSDMAQLCPKTMAEDSGRRLNAFARELGAFADELSAKGVRLAILYGVPLAREAQCTPDMAVSQWFRPFGGICTMPGRSETIRRLSELRRVLAGLESTGALTVIDVLDVFCHDEQCTYFSRDGQCLYRDEYSHPSVEAARLCAPVIRRRLLTARPDGTGWLLPEDGPVGPSSWAADGVPESSCSVSQVR